jgi:hypothetical protein
MVKSWEADDVEKTSADTIQSKTASSPINQYAGTPQ